MARAFGWCLTGHHPLCKVSFEFANNVVTCSCDCHTEKETNANGEGSQGTDQSPKRKNQRASSNRIEDASPAKTKPRPVTRTSKKGN